MRQFSQRTTWRRLLTAVPAVGMALLPRAICPCTMPAFAGLVGSFGLAFVLDTAFQLPLTAAFLLLAVTMLAYRAKNRRGAGPFYIGIVAAIIVLIAKFVMDSTPAVFGGIALLIGASIWNSWPKSAKGDSAAPTEKLYQIGKNVILF